MDEGWNVVYYQASQSRTSPVYDFIESLDRKAQSKVSNSLDLLEKYGIQLGQPHVKKVTGTDLWELRILGSDSTRIFYVAVTGKNFLLLHGFRKKKQKTDQREIRTALERLREYRSRVSL
ncbi:MAG: type II toxin-antitoxin system RelE/ParE family toxin [bacterium]|nr:type II toxin-antitoxin system RelE/ParE family toxin [bacterium]